ncbi:GAF domain-containing protein [cf. Phormidesmis sp. LEGE 11477]|uniref:sensor histidine kinase n=1 Tax=cf. Phormidesmis sp. LEGE 11477 TaxID=1828680 RepID=UPI00187E23C4|nr:GAF domain-containing protein [cf. Phormidesmis sp. LEGE 11477]MBE9063389.1 GAF domain-containing protein [cf. Phormidesmis sp. LEGE 11477]
MAKPKTKTTRTPQPIPDRRVPQELRQQDLGQILPAILAADTLEAAIKTALEAIQTEFGYSLLWVGLYDRVAHNLETKGVLAPDSQQFTHSTLDLQPGNLLEQVVIQQQPIVIADIREESRAGTWTQVAKSFDLQGTVILPIKRQNQCHGLIVLGSRRWGMTPGIAQDTTLLTISYALAEVIHQAALEAKRQQTKRPAKPLLELLKTLGNLPGLDTRLSAVVKETEVFVGAKASVYWLESRGRHFWCRVGKGKEKEILPVSEVQSLYQMLCNNEPLVVSELESSVKASTANRLMVHLGAQSLMVAPILYRDELQGFLTVAGNSHRDWSEAEQAYIGGAAQLLGLAMPTAEMDEAVSRLRSDHLLSAGITRSIHGDRDWLHVLGLCVEQLAARIGSNQLLVLRANSERGGYDLCYQTGQQVSQLRDPVDHWNPLDDVDDQMLRRAHSPASVEDLTHDLKFAAWQSRLQTMGAKSLLVSNTSPGHAPEGIVIVVDKIARRWSHAERELLQTLSNQIGLILHQWSLQRQTDHHAQLHQAFQWSMRSLQRLSKIEALDKSAARQLAQLMHVPLVGLVVWENGAATAKALQVLAQNNKFRIDGAKHISIETDALLNWAVSTEELLTLKLEDLPAEDRWITAPAGAQLLVMALRTAPEHEPNAVVIVADSGNREWSEEQTDLLAIIVNQLAWCRRHIKLTQAMLSDQQQLIQLNWYKQHQIEDLQRGFEECLKQGVVQSETSDPRQKMLVQKMESLGNRIKHVTQHERWAVDIQAKESPLISLLKRVTARAHSLVQSRQLWLKVHREGNLTILGDAIKIEFVLYELLVAACQRSPVGDRIDIWCRPIDQHWLEISITDEGSVDPALLQALAKGRSEDLLSPSAIMLPQNSHLWVCQSLMKALGGECSLSQIEDGRMLSRVIVPLV